MSTPNPFQRFARPRDEAQPKQRVKRLLSPRAATPAKRQRPEATTKEEAIDDDPRLAMLARMQSIRKGMIAQVDIYGTQQLYSATMAPKDQRWQILIASLLSTQTRDEITAAAMMRLHTLPGGLTLASVLALSVAELDALLCPVGFHLKKAEQLLRIAEILQTRYGSDIPVSIADLMELPGIGPKVARLIALVAWNRADGIIVDTHVHRIARRLGWTSATVKTAEDTRRELEAWIPADKWGDMSKLLIGFGQTHCKAYLDPMLSVCANYADQEGTVVDGTLDTGSTALTLVASALVMIVTPSSVLLRRPRRQRHGVQHDDDDGHASQTSFWLLGTTAFGSDGLYSWATYVRQGREAPECHVRATSSPHIVVALFQTQFATITPALLSVDRIRFSTYVILLLLCTPIVYDPLANWMWSRKLGDNWAIKVVGWEGKLDALDFAGGSIIHVPSGSPHLGYSFVDTTLLLILALKHTSVSKEKEILGVDVVYRPHAHPGEME
ncbi:hypothetical protein SPRG_03038 [Saprolegnia parasitica CBS 223.65]|uniref:HhH-GPD domain-containing protein n=1 Tax=Saprolegnia parasitica (strain CBS 223.65) TaxID=695850 RepID=A0A067CPX1_SAPPC|nr:hypothetical protein SPRG_03038 [Saprolegnia parasitica CBS 223.65]KDO32563.1 hypothetical protein SPRG_03038 [Saprolegnia parasitica CBS 223.65]|eukprot:XP_012197009.1 hypothetical protein SPRG_03038 [Saprolegnia parasitica CBS 223.65]